MEQLESHCLKSQVVSRVHKPSKGEQRSTWLFHNKKVQVLLSTYPEVMDDQSKDAEGSFISLETIAGINHARELYVANAQTELYLVMKNNFAMTHKQILSKYSPERNCTPPRIMQTQMRTSMSQVQIRIRTKARSRRACLASVHARIWILAQVGPVTQSQGRSWSLENQLRRVRIAVRRASVVVQESRSIGVVEIISRRALPGNGRLSICSKPLQRSLRCVSN